MLRLCQDLIQGAKIGLCTPRDDRLIDGIAGFSALELGPYPGLRLLDRAVGR